LLLGPGPSNAHPTVLQALSRTPIGHLDPLYVALMGEVQELLRYVWQTDNRLTLPMSGTGSAAMEATLANMVEPGDTVLVAVKGYFGLRLADMAGRVNSPDLTILFVTVDPDRDTDAVLADYAKAFSPQVVGLRGTDNQLASLARTYRVAYSVKKGPPYEVMHSNAVFFFDKDGKARLVTTDTANAVAMADDVKRLLK